MLSIEQVMQTGYYLIVDRQEKNTIEITVGESLTEGKCVDTIKIVFDEIGFIKLYLNNEEKHRLIRECKTYELFNKCCVDYINNLRIKCRITENLVYEKIENNLIKFNGDSNE